MRAIPERLRDALCGGAIQIDYLYLYLLLFKPQMKECMTLKCMFLFVICETIICICYAFTKEAVFSSALVVHLFICQLARLGKNYRD